MKKIQLMFAAALLPFAAQAGPFAFGEWSGSCEGPQACFAQMRGEGARLLVGWHQLESRMRLGALLPPTVGTDQPATLWLDDQTSVYLETNSCTQTYCEAMVHAEKTAAVIDLFKKARGGVISYPEDGKIRTSEITLNGFTKTVNQIQSAVKQ